MKRQMTLLDFIVKEQPKLLEAYRHDAAFRAAVDLCNQQLSRAGQLDVLLNALADYGHENHMLRREIVSRRTKTTAPIEILGRLHGDPLAT